MQVPFCILRSTLYVWEATVALGSLLEPPLTIVRNPTINNCNHASIAVHRCSAYAATTRASSAWKRATRKNQDHPRLWWCRRIGRRRCPLIPRTTPCRRFPPIPRRPNLRRSRPPSHRGRRNSPPYLRGRLISTITFRPLHRSTGPRPPSPPPPPLLLQRQRMWSMEMTSTNSSVA